MKRKKVIAMFAESRVILPVVADIARVKILKVKPMFLKMIWLPIITGLLMG